MPKIRKITDDTGEIALLSRQSYKNFKKNYPDFIYDRKSKTYKVPSEKSVEILIIKKTKKKVIKKRKKVIKRKIKKEKKEPEKEIIEKEERIRRQVVLNFVNRDASDSFNIFISIRAITINPEYNENALKIVIDKAMRDYEILSGLKFRYYKKSYFGVEKEEISSSEDKILNDYKIHVEIFHGGKVVKEYSVS